MTIEVELDKLKENNRKLKSEIDRKESKINILLNKLQLIESEMNKHDSNK